MSTIADKLNLLRNTKKSIRQAIIDKGGTVTVNPFSGYAKAIENISTVNNQDKTITESGVYTADDGYTGLGTVTVNVAAGSTTYKAMLVMDSIVNSTDAASEDEVISSVQTVLTTI